MTKGVKSAYAGAARSSAAERYDDISIMFHWITVLLIVVQFVSIWVHASLGHYSGLGSFLLSMHRTAGTLTLAVVVGRLIWRRHFAYLPALPASMPIIQQLLAKANEYSLYALLVAMPITGLARVILRGQPFDLIVLQVPALISPHLAARAVFAKAHEAGATVLTALIVLHVSAALLHQLVLRDDIPQRMLPQGSSHRKNNLVSGPDGRE